MSGTLFIVATPIGNLEDISHRALRVLREVDLIACEDTRHTARLLTHFNVKTKTVSYHEHNEQARSKQLCRLLLQGSSIAIVSDAGTPLINDPGFRLVNEAIDANIPVTPVPGAAAFVAALSASGLPTDQFFFGGFLPSRASARRAKLSELATVDATLIFYESPHRIAAALADAYDILGDRHAVVARELTKLHEEFARERLSQLAESFAGDVRGEMVLMISGKRDAGGVQPHESGARLAQRVEELEMDGLDAKTALKKAARELGLKRDEAYRLIEGQKNRRIK